MGQDKSVVLLGRLAGAYGIKGWLKVSSYTQPKENILQYVPWRLRRAGNTEVLRAAELIESRVHGKGLIVRLAGVDDRSQAEQLQGMEIIVDRRQLPEAEDGQYYWADLEGLRVETADGRPLGQVDQMLEAGAADVMVVCGTEEPRARHLIPFIRGEVILAVDLDAGLIRVNWDHDS